MRGGVSHHAFGCLCFALSGQKRFQDVTFLPCFAHAGTVLTCASSSKCMLAYKKKKKVTSFQCGCMCVCKSCSAHLIAASCMVGFGMQDEVQVCMCACAEQDECGAQ